MSESPPLAGLFGHAEAARPGVSVAESSDRLWRLAYAYRRIVRFFRFPIEIQASLARFEPREAHLLLWVIEPDLMPRRPARSTSSRSRRCTATRC